MSKEKTLEECQHKIDKRIKYKLVVDIETANIIEDAIAYDIGFAVTDKKGKIYETYSYMVSEMFFDNKDLLDTAYYSEKLPQYWEDYKNGKREIASILTIRNKIRQLIKTYKIRDVFAYNAFFDSVGLNKTIRYLTKSKIRYFFPRGIKFHCIWHMACQTIFQQKTFPKVAILNDWISESGNVKTSAEIAHRYITKDNSFEESHTGLEDVLIETQIMAKCYAQHKKMKTNINRGCWRIPQKAFKEEYSKLKETC